MGDAHKEPRLQRALAERIESVWSSWDGTPYLLNHAIKGVGVDCIRYVCAGVNELYGIPQVDLPKLPRDTAMHNRAGAIAVVRLVRRMYPNHEFVTDGKVQPGDIIITAKPGCGPGHSMIVSARPNVLWHAASGSVHRTGFGVLSGADPQYRPFVVFRMTDRWTWVN